MDPSLQTNRSVAALELYSGIGGFHYAFQGFGEYYFTRAAVDINTTANVTYAQNFPNTQLFQRNIQSFSANAIDELNINLMWMSPPCQPFTRLGKQRDCDDKRTDSFMHIVDTIPKLQKKPSYILLENVKGFETSQACSSFKRMLEQTNYIYQEFLLSPHQLGIPNSRLRYYIIAKLSPLQFKFPTSVEIMLALPTGSFRGNVSHQSCTDSPSKANSLKPFLETESSDDRFEAYGLPDKVLLKFANILDIVSSSSTQSCCFTKAYNHYVEGTGSVLHGDERIKISDVYDTIKSVKEEDEKLRLLKMLKLRYFTPREVANLMGFPPHFQFPDHFTARQKYRLLGNSLNVTVVHELLKLCFENQ